MKHLKRLLCLLLAVGLTLTLCACGNKNNRKDADVEKKPRKATTDTAKRGNQIGDLCYGTTLTEIDQNGYTNHTFDPTELGKITVINFWAYWCPPCVGELPHFDQVAEEYADEVAVIAVHCDALKEAQTFIGENYPDSFIRFAMDDADDPYAYYEMLGGTGSIPYTVILDANGIIRKTFTGAVTLKALVTAVESCLVDTDQTPTNQEVMASTIGISLSQEEYAIGIRKEDTDLQEQVNAFLQQVKTDGTLDNICNRYFGNGTPIPVTSTPKDDSKNQLVVATSTGYEPFEMVANGQYYGIDMELAAALADYLGKELVIIDLLFEAVVDAVENDMCDIAIAALTATSDRKQQVAFSDPYYYANQTLLVPNNCTDFDDCQTAEDVEAVLATKDMRCKIGCQAGSIGAVYISGDEDYGFPGLNVTMIEYSNTALAIAAMLNGDIDYVIVDYTASIALLNIINGG